MKIFNINDSYFKYQKCLSGTTYQFVNQLDNIYEKNLMVGTNYCIYCMYNEFDIINNFMVNLYQIDVCSTINLDITQKYYKIDNANLKTGHKVLLVAQTNPAENDIYTVDSRGYLILSDELATTGKTWRYKAYIKLGDNKGKQYHLINSGNRFPLKGERKYFLDGHGYIIKSTFNYDINDTGPIVPKLIFTDYEFARISVNKNYELYNGFYLPSFITGDTVDIQYHGNSYIINIDDDSSKYIYTGVTSGGTHDTGSTIYNYNDLTTDGFGYETYILTDSTFCSNSSVYDYLKFEISGETNLYLNTFIKRIDSPYIIISDYINDKILNDYYTGGTTATYTLTNLQYSPQSTIKETMLESFYSKYFNIDDSNYLYPIEYTYNKYVDYDGFQFVFSGDTTIINTFLTQNHYINYKLYEHLNEINSSLFNSGYSFLIHHLLYSGDFTTEYYDSTDPHGTLLKITPTIPSDTNYFKKYTYVNLPALSGKTLIVDLVPNEYFIIETYKADSGSTINEIETIYNLEEISDILYDVYINDETPTNINYYRIREGSMRKNICNAYADFISQDTGIIDQVTAFLMQDSENKFLLKIYDPENLYNGGFSRPPIVETIKNAVVSSSSVRLTANVTDEGGSNITARGIIYGLNPEYLTLYTSAYTYSTGEYVVGIYPLNFSTTYYYKPYAINEETIAYGDIDEFTTLSPDYSLPSLITLNDVPYETEININAEVMDKGYTDILYRGVVYQTGTTSPILTDESIFWEEETGEIGFYSVELTGLTTSTLYSYNSFAINICGVTYGNSGYTTTT